MRTHCFASGEFEPANKTFAEATYAAFLQNAKNVAGGIPRVCTLGWYAMPLQGMGFETGLGHGIRNTMGAHGIGNRLRKAVSYPCFEGCGLGANYGNRGQRPTATEEKDTLARAARWDLGGLFLLLSGEVGHEVDELLFGHGWGEGGHEGGRHFVAAGEVGFFQF